MGEERARTWRRSCYKFVDPGSRRHCAWVSSVVTRLWNIARPIEWFYYAAGLVLVLRYRWLMDDAFVYFRYVDNLLFLGAGLTYNAGEYVEGFTSPLHCLLLIPLRATELSYATITHGLGVVWWTLFWWLLVRLNRSLSPPGVRAWNLPLAYLCTNYAVTSYFTSGLESPLALLAGAVLAHFFVRPESRVWSFAVALCPLVRPELAVAAVFSCAYAGWRLRRFPRFLVAMIALVNVPWLVFRVWYYADLLPNTFYLKDTDRWDWGWSFLLDATMSYWFPVFVAAAGIALIYVVRSRIRQGLDVEELRLDARAAMLMLAAIMTVYVVKIGGGAIHWYYVWSPAVLAIAASAGVLEWAHQGLRIRRQVPVALAMAGTSVLVFFCYSTLLDEHPRHLKQVFKIEGIVADPAHHRVRPHGWLRNLAVQDQRDFAPVLAASGYDGIGTDGFCATIYYRFDQHTIHRYGLTDAFLARCVAAERRKGHKPTLRPLAEDLVELMSSAERIGPGMFRNAVSEGRAPQWVVSNVDTIEWIARKVYNRHDFVENLRLATTRVPAIDPGEVDLSRKRPTEQHAPIPSKLKGAREREERQPPSDARSGD